MMVFCSTFEVDKVSSGMHHMREKLRQSAIMLMVFICHSE